MSDNEPTFEDVADARVIAGSKRHDRLRSHPKRAARVPECKGASLPGFHIPCGQDPVGNGSGNCQ